MKKTWIVIISIVAVIFIGFLWFKGMYNNMVNLDVDSTGQWANVESAYQRRADLIPNLVSTVKGYADFEKETLTAVIEARAKATQVKIDPSNISPEQLANFQSAQGEVSQALGRLLVTIERYPDLKANQNFLELQSQLEGTENRINVERNRFNETVKAYNKYIKRFPQVLFAGSFGYEEKGFFKADAGSENAPKVEF
jgi:LemA protein